MFRQSLRRLFEMRMIIALVLVLVLPPSLCSGQYDPVVLDGFSMEGHPFRSSKEDVVKAFGEYEVTYPDYDCGYFAEAWTGIRYQQLQFAQCTYIGSEEGEFVLESVRFDPDGKVVLRYGDHPLSGRTTKEELAEIFNIGAAYFTDREPDHDVFLLYTKNEDGVRFTFSEGRLVRFDHWTPC